MSQLTATLQFILNNQFELTPQITDSSEIDQFDFDDKRDVPIRRYLEIGAKFTYRGSRYEIEHMIVNLDKTPLLESPPNQIGSHAEVHTLVYVKEIV